jgi:hypothetical protein
MQKIYSKYLQFLKKIKYEEMYWNGKVLLLTNAVEQKILKCNEMGLKLWMKWNVAIVLEWDGCSIAIKEKISFIYLPHSQNYWMDLENPGLQYESSAGSWNPPGTVFKCLADSIFPAPPYTSLQICMRIEQ